MTPEIWVGFVELRQLAGENHLITLAGKGAFTWIACWATDEASYKARVEEVETGYGLSVVEVEQSMPFARAEEGGIVDEELVDICERTSRNESYCIYGTFYSYPNDN